MYGGNTYVIRLATPDDEHAMGELAQIDSQRPVTGPALIGEIGGRPAAAVSLEDGRVVADPFQATSHLVVQLRLRADALRAYETTPSLAERVRAAVRVAQIEARAQI